MTSATVSPTPALDMHPSRQAVDSKLIFTAESVEPAETDGLNSALGVDFIAAGGLRGGFGLRPASFLALDSPGRLRRGRHSRFSPR
jgi:hypothetical protein